MQVRVYDLQSMSCSYVLAGHTEIVVCLDTCVSRGVTLVVTGSKDNTVSGVIFGWKCSILAAVSAYYLHKVHV